jgi:mevalonate pyrophosphate decarboxylase
MAVIGQGLRAAGAILQGHEIAVSTGIQRSSMGLYRSRCEPATDTRIPGFWAWYRVRLNPRPRGAGVAFSAAAWAAAATALTYARSR